MKNITTMAITKPHNENYRALVQYVIGTREECEQMVAEMNKAENTDIYLLEEVEEMMDTRDSFGFR